MNKHRPSWLLAVTTIAGVLFLGTADWSTGYKLNFVVFYFLPVSIIVWTMGLLHQWLYCIPQSRTSVAYRFSFSMRAVSSDTDAA